MNILFVIPSLMRAGAERVVVNTCNELVKDPGNKVSIYLIQNKNEYQSELDDRISVVGGGVSFHLSLYKKNHIENAKYVDFVNQFKPDVIHSHLFFGDILSHSYHVEGARYFSHLHNSKIENYNGFELNRITSKSMWTNRYEYKWLIARYTSFGTSFIACSAGAQRLHKEKIQVGHVITLPNAIPLPKATSSMKEMGEVLQLIWIGRLNEVKRPKIAISIAHRLKEIGIPFHLKIAGIGPELENCRAKIQQLSLEVHVEMMGLVADLQPIYHQANLMIHTSQYEGLPMVFIEAGANGIPIITTDCLPENDIIENGVNGRIIPSEEIEDFTRAISEMINTPKSYQELSRNARKRAEEFGIEQYVQKLVLFYTKN
ncbi:MAG: glycosyltransferase [Crocinitomicaceae bacterium]